MVGEKSTAVVQAVNFEGKSCMKSINSLQCELVSLITGATERGNVEHKGQNRYEISYCPTIKGKHQLHIKIEDTHISGSPFSVRVKLPVEKLGTPILTIDGVNTPRGVVVNQRGEVVVTEGRGVSVFSPSGKKLQSFGSDQGQSAFPWGVAVDGEDNILVADTKNYRIQKFTANGLFLCAVGTRGEGPLQFNRPMYIAFNAINNKIYVTDTINFRVQVLNSDLTFSNIFGRKGNGSGQFNGMCGIACDSIGNVYVVDAENHRIQVFTADGKFLRIFGKCGSGRGELNVPWGIAIDSSDVVYVSENVNHRVSVFTSKGQFMSSFGEEWVGPGEFKCPHGVAVDDSGVVYVCDGLNDRIQVF